MGSDVLSLAPFLRTHTLSFTSQGQGDDLHQRRCQNVHHQHVLIFVITILIPSVLPFEYGDSDWRVAIKLVYKNMVQESRHNLNQYFYQYSNINILNALGCRN